ncbi:hypothetical protein A33M_0758 [Rhodovulum sp. PH10]|nr:hypothetical protein A33M_0758 [Rhodovulum sp. PH10]
MRVGTDSGHLRPQRRGGTEAAGAAFAIALAALLQGCSLGGPFFDDGFEKSRTVSSEPVPPYRKLVADSLTRSKIPHVHALAISEPRWIERIGGPAWIVCVRSGAEGHGTPPAPPPVPAGSAAAAPAATMPATTAEASADDTPAVYYAYFIKQAAIVDTRTAVGTDRCVHQTFSPFDPAVAAAADDE